MTRLICASIALIALTAGEAMGATIVFSDGTFNDSDWNVPAQLGLVFAGQRITGGNPGSYREVALAVGQNAPFAANLDRTFVYNPSTQGAVTGITYNIDLITTNAEGAGYFALVQQDGILYVDPNVNTMERNYE